MTGWISDVQNAATGVVDSALDGIKSLKLPEGIVSPSATYKPRRRPARKDHRIGLHHSGHRNGRCQFGFRWYQVREATRH